MCMCLSDHLLRLDFVGRVQEGEGGQWKSEWGEESGEGPWVREGRESEATFLYFPRLGTIKEESDGISGCLG